MSDRDQFALPDSAPELSKTSLVKKTPQNALRELALDFGLPADIDAEKTILGAILLDNETFYEVNEQLRPGDFSLDSHQRIYLRIHTLMEHKSTVDIVTLAHELSRNKEVEVIGGVAYLASLTEGLPLRPVIEDYLRIVKDKAVLRGIMSIATSAIARAADQSFAGLEVASLLAAQLEEIVSGGLHKGLEPVANITIEVMDRFQKQSELVESPGLSYGVEGIDQATSGILPSEQVVVGCFSGVGKTTLLAQIIAANCTKGHPCAVFLLEPTRDSFLRQLWTIAGDVRYIAATKPWYADSSERERLRWSAINIGDNWPLWICDKTNLSLDEQVAMSRLAIHRHGVELIGIDYLQRMKVASLDRNDDTRLKMARASMANVDVVKNTNCRNVLLSQLNRAGGMSAVPSMDKLRETGQIENDATTVVLLHLKYDEEQGHFTDEGAAIIPKQRFGVPCNVKLHKDKHTALWCTGSKDEHRQERMYYSGGQPT